MGFLDKILKKNTNLENEIAKEESLRVMNLRKESVSKVCLDKEELSNLTSRVAVVMDFSATMTDLYIEGWVQTLLERLFPLALELDNTSEMGMWLFETSFQRMPSVNIDNCYNYLKNEDVLRKYKMGGTNYAPVMADVVRRYTKEEPSNIPTLVLFLTDGDNFDKKEAVEAIRECSGNSIFWQFVGLGENSQFKFLNKIDKLNGRVINNVGFFSINEIDSMNDDELYKKLLSNYPNWLNVAKQKNIIE